MQKLSWLENLQKSEPAPPLPAPAVVIDEFRDLFTIGDVVIEKSDSPFPTGGADIPSATELVIEAERNRRFHIGGERREQPVEKLFSVETSTEGFIEEGLAKILGVQEMPTEELLGRADQRKLEVAKNSKAAEAFNVGGQILAKGEVASRMGGILAQIRFYCEGQEAELLEKSIKALDMAAFGELAERVLARMKRALH